MKINYVILAACLSASAWADVYKCTDASGHHFYQSSPCPEVHNAIQMNPKTGNSLDLTAQERQTAEQAERKRQQFEQELAQREVEIAAIEQRKLQAKAEYELTQTMIRQNPGQFSAYAVPWYDPVNLPPHVKAYETRMVDIEKFRRMAAQKVLGNGQCQRVEADELSPKSSPESLVFMINCSSGATYYLNEADLKQ